MIVPLTDAQLKEIQKSYPKSQAETDQDLAIIRHWLNKQPHLPKTSDDTLKKMMFSLKYRTEKIKTVIDNFYSVKEIFPQIYSDQDPTTNEFRKQVEITEMFPLPKLTPELNRVLCYRIVSSDGRAFCADIQLKRNELMWNWLFDKDALTLGNVWIFDLGNMDSMAHWTHFNLSFMKKVLKISMDAKPVRIKKVHFVNISSMAEATLNFIKNFFPQKYRDRIIFNATSQGLQDYYPLDMLPAEWGGKAGTMSELNEKMYEILVKEKNWCIDLEHMKADSSKRIGQSKTADQSILGIEGNFKKLDFD